MARMTEDDYWEQYDDRLPHAQPRGETEMVICGDCNGSGEGMYDGSRCRTCGGSGEVEVDVDLDAEDGDGQDEGELEARGI